MQSRVTKYLQVLKWRHDSSFYLFPPNTVPMCFQVNVCTVYVCTGNDVQYSIDGITDN